MKNMDVSPEGQMDDKVVFRRSHFYAIMVVFAFTVGILVGYVAWGRNPAIPAANQPQNPSLVDRGQQNPEDVMQYLVSQARHVEGADDAKVVLIEFSDYK